MQEMQEKLEKLGLAEMAGPLCTLLDSQCPRPYPFDSQLEFGGHGRAALMSQEVFMNDTPHSVCSGTYISMR